MWETQSEPVPSGRRYRLCSESRPLSFRQLFDKLQNEAVFRDWYTVMLASVAPPACFWEHPPLTEQTFDDAAEFVLIDAPMLARLRPEPGPFGNQFARHAGAEVITFSNLGGDALLVTPAPVASPEVYPHLAAFVRGASTTQLHALWTATARAVHDALGDEPCWLSTSGLGVAWLHIRLDTQPKYYQHRPYKDLPPDD